MMELKQEQMKQQHNKKRRPGENFKPGDLVWLEATNVTSKRPSKKLDNRRYGPFPIMEKIGEGAYRIKLPEGWVIHDVFNEALLTRHHGPEFDSQKAPLPPPPEIINSKEEYEIDEI